MCLPWLDNPVDLSNNAIHIGIKDRNPQRWTPNALRNRTPPNRQFQTDERHYRQTIHTPTLQIRCDSNEAGTMTYFNELIYWHSHTYGNAVRIKKRILQVAATIACIATPGTNWLLAFVPKIQDLVVRWWRWKDSSWHLLSEELAFFLF